MPDFLPLDDPSDPRLDPYRDIRERDLLGRQGLFVAEGTVVLEKLVASETHRPRSVLIADKRVAAHAPLLAMLPHEVPVFVASPAVIDAVAGFPLHRGVLAIGQRTTQPSADALLAAAASRRDDPAAVLLLAGIANHDNMGGLFRNAAAFGAGAVLLDADCCDPLYRKAIRVSVGAALTIPFARLARGEDPVALLDRHGFEAVSLSPAGATTLADWQPGRRTAVLLGAEGPGLAPALIARTRSVRIAMAAGFDSLNVATTSGIVLHHWSVRR